MKSTRLEEIDGHFHGIHFKVKPTPIAIEKYEKEISDMWLEWHKKNQPEAVDPPEIVGQFLAEQVSFKDMSDDDMKAVEGYITSIKAWRQDVDFRSKILRRKAELAMDFEKPVPEDVWTSDDLEYSTIEEAWDFFCGRRSTR